MTKLYLSWLAASEGKPFMAKAVWKVVYNMSLGIEQKREYREFLQRCTVKQGDFEQSAKVGTALRELSESIVPKILYRYRSASTHSFSDLERGLITFASPVVFDDPADSCPQSSLAGLNNAIEALSDSECGLQLLQSIDYAKLAHVLRKTDLNDTDKRFAEFNAMPQEAKVRRLRDAAPIVRKIALSNVIPALQNSCRQSFRIMCLTCNGNSERMWTDYAGNHSGFIIAYKSDDVRCCNVDSRCDVGAFLLPILYDDVPFDVERQVQWAMLVSMGFNVLPDDIMDNFRTAYRKSTRYEYEDEFRAALLPREEEREKDYVQRQCRAFAVVLGNCMDGPDRARCIKAANSLGIPWFDERSFSEDCLSVG